MNCPECEFIQYYTDRNGIAPSQLHLALASSISGSFGHNLDCPKYEGFTAKQLNAEFNAIKKMLESAPLSESRPAKP